MLKRRIRKPKDQAGEAGQQPAPGQALAPELPAALAALHAALDPCGDVVFRPLTIAGDPAAQAAVVFCKSVVEEKDVNQQLLQPLVLHLPQALRNQSAPVAASELCRLLEQGGLPAANPQAALNVSDAVSDILSGYAAVLVDGCSGALLIRLKAEVGRQVTEQVAETVARGPREGFVEGIDTNLFLVRSRLPVPEFRVENRTIGRRTRTKVALLYLEGICNPSVVDEVRRRLDGIQIDAVLESGYIEEMIEDQPRSPFPTMEHTERPDKVAASLLEGRAAILTDSTPMALLVPALFVQFMHASEDYYDRYLFTAAIRLIRYLAFFFALTLPSIYVAVTTYHHEMIPAPLFIALAAQREGVPWPAFVEAFLMEVSFEMLREAGLRLPKPVGQAVSIVGGLVIGEAAIRAKIVSPAMVIVVSLTGIASFAIPAYNLAISLRMLRFPIMILAATLGLHGVVVGMLALLIHLCGLRSFGVPYLAPLAPALPADWKDLIGRTPWWQQRMRPLSLGSPDRQRVPPGQRPGPGSQG